MKKPYRSKIVKHSQRQVKRLKDHTDYQKLDSIRDSDIPETDAAFWVNAQVQDPGPKKAISLRVDQDVLSWFKHREGRYQ